MNKLSQYLVDIRKLYAEGKACTEIAKLYRADSRTVIKLLKEAGVEIRTSTISASLVNRKDYDYFDKINSEDRAYFLGLMSADGTIYTPKVKAQRQLKIQLKYEDGYIIEEFKRLTGATQKLVDDKRGTYALTVCSDKLCNDLESLGVCALKINRTELPVISKKYTPHYIRGLFDGDGCIYKGRTRGCSVTFTSPSLVFISNLKIYLESSGLIISKVNDYATYYTIGIYSKDSIKKFYNIVYHNSSFYLKRKKNTYDSIMEGDI